VDYGGIRKFMKMKRGFLKQVSKGFKCGWIDGGEMVGGGALRN